MRTALIIRMGWVLNFAKKNYFKNAPYGQGLCSRQGQGTPFSPVPA